MKKTTGVKGIVVVNKPSGMTSHDVVSVVRRKFGMRRVGHAGTLDPLATGVLVILLGEATKLFQKFEAFDKAYRATMILGTRTATADIEGEVLEERPYASITREQFEQALGAFRGDIAQVPPMFSAVKVNGKKLYELARQGLEVKREPRQIHIHELSLLTFDPPRARIYLGCSKGTYVRKLAEDIAERLDNIACIAEIERVRVGPFDIKDAVALDDLTLDQVREWSG